MGFEWIVGGVMAAATAAILGNWLYKALWFQTTIFEYEHGLLFQHGKLIRELDAGQHRRFGRGYSVVKLDNRSMQAVVSNQELMTLDGLAVRISAGVHFVIVDFKKVMFQTQDYVSAAYLEVHQALRLVVGEYAADTLLEKRLEIQEKLFGICEPAFAALGLKLERVVVRDLVFAGDLKRAYADVLIAQKEAQAAMERARGEVSSLRALANAAKLLEDHPGLLQLRALQAASGSQGPSFVFHSPDVVAKT